MNVCSLGDQTCIEHNIRAQVDAYTRIPNASELSAAGAAQLARLTAGGRRPTDFELLELNLKGRPRGSRDTRPQPTFDGVIRRADVTALMEAAQVNSDRYIREMIGGMFMEHIDTGPKDNQITASEWAAAGRQSSGPTLPEPAPRGVRLPNRS